jgi:hypothetical protein
MSSALTAPPRSDYVIPDVNRPQTQTVITLTPRFAVWVQTTLRRCRVDNCTEPTPYLLVFRLPTLSGSHPAAGVRHLPVCKDCAIHGFGIPVERLMESHRWG